MRALLTELLRLPLLVGALALALRLLHLVFASKLLLADDAEFFEQHAGEFLTAWRALGTSGWWPLLRHAVDESSLQGPLYPLFASLVYLVAGGVSHVALAVVQVLVGAATVVLTCLTGRRAFGPAVGLAAGLLAAVYPPLIASTGQLLAEALLTGVQALALYFLVRGPGAGRWRAGLLGGVCIGLLMLRPAFQYSGALMLVALAAANVLAGAGVRRAAVAGAGDKPPRYGSGKAAARAGDEPLRDGRGRGAVSPRARWRGLAGVGAAVAPFLAGVLIVAAPWVAMNGLVFGQFVWSRTGDAWHQVYWGIYPPNHGWWPPDSPVPPKYGVESLPGARSSGMVIEERDLDYLHAAVDQVRATPLKVAATEVNKLYQGYLHPSDTYAEHPPLVGWAAVPLHRVTILLGLAGLCFGWIAPRRRAPWLILAAGLFASALPFLASHVDLRYTIPPSQVLSLFAALGLVEAAATAGRLRRRAALPASRRRAAVAAVAVPALPLATWVVGVPWWLAVFPSLPPWYAHLAQTALICSALLASSLAAGGLLWRFGRCSPAGGHMRAYAAGALALGTLLAGVYGTEALYEGDWHQWTAQLRPGDAVRQTFVLPVGWQPPAGGRAEVRLYVAGTREPDYEPIVRVNGREAARLGPALSDAGPLRFWEKIMVAARNQGKARVEVAQWLAVPVDYAAVAGPQVEVAVTVAPAGNATFPEGRLRIWGDYPPRPGLRLYEGPAVYSRIQGQDEAFLKFIATGEYGIWRRQPLQSVSVQAARWDDPFGHTRFGTPAATEGWRSDDLSPSAGTQAGEYRIRLLVYAANGDLAALF